jgi:uncharacterized membrane protein
MSLPQIETAETMATCNRMMVSYTGVDGSQVLMYFWALTFMMMVFVFCINFLMIVAMFAFRREHSTVLAYTIGKFLENQKQQTSRGPSMLEMMLSSVLAITADDKTETAKTADAKTADAETNAAKTADADASKTADASSSTASETDTKEASAPDTPTEAESKPAACKRTTSSDIFSDENNLI